MIEQDGLFPIESVRPLITDIDERAIVTDIKHSHYGFSLAQLSFRGRNHFVMLITDELSLEEADELCMHVPDWWDETIDPRALY